MCVEAGAAIAWWGGIRFADFLAAFPPVSGAKWASMRSSVSLEEPAARALLRLDRSSTPLRHPQTLLATHQGADRSARAWLAAAAAGPVKLGSKHQGGDGHRVPGDRAPRLLERASYSKYDGL